MGHMRRWVTTATSEGLTELDCQIINRAIRALVGREQPTTLQIMEVRMKYKPGMSARDILDLIEDQESREELARIEDANRLY